MGGSPNSPSAPSVLTVYLMLVRCRAVACTIYTLNSQGWYRGIQLFKMADMQIFPPPEYTHPHQI